ncbi:MAG TPA: OmpA family protein [Desulfatiglandales bacterium]|nr:OmpA family protein [Desulfatiglandales bacterium]
MSRPILSTLSKAMVLCMLIIPFGCGGGHRIFYKPDYTNRYYVPKQIPVKPGMILRSEFNVVCTVNVINNQTNAKKVPIGAYSHQWWGSLMMWTDTAVGLLKSELLKRQVDVIEESPKLVKLSITNVKLYWGFDYVGCTLNLNVETGDGYIVNLEETVESTDLYDSCDGAVTKAVAAMFNDWEIRNYLTSLTKGKDSDCDGILDEMDKCPGTPLGIDVDEYGCPLDTDGDGVPDYLDQCPGTPKGVRVDDRGCPLDTDGDGVPDYLDKCPDTPRGVKVNELGCPIDTDGDGVFDDRDQCPDTPKGAWVDERGCWVIPDPLFDFDKYEIKPQYYSVLDRVVAILKRNPSLKVEIQGHTCNMGTAEYNMALSENRAGAILDYLVKKGIDKNRLTAVGYGLTRPKVSNETEADRRLNRRVELKPIR